MYCPYGNNVHFSHTSRICFSVTNTLKNAIQTKRQLNRFMHLYTTESPLVTVGCPTPKIASCHGPIANSNYLPYLWTQPTHLLNRHPDPVSCFSTIHRTNKTMDQWTNWQMEHATSPVPVPVYTLYDDATRVIIINGDGKCGRWQTHSSRWLTCFVVCWPPCAQSSFIK